MCDNVKDGYGSSPNMASLSNTQTFPSTYNTAQTLEYQKLHKRTYPQMILPPSLSLPLLKRSSPGNLTRDATQDLSPVWRLKKGLVLSKPRHYPWYQKQGSQASSALYRTYLSHGTIRISTLSTTHSIPTPSHAPGEHSPLSAPSSITSPQVCKGHAKTWQKHTTSSHWHQISGQGWLYTSLDQTSSRSTNAIHSVLQQQVDQPTSSTKCIN